MVLQIRVSYSVEANSTYMCSAIWLGLVTELPRRSTTGYIVVDLSCGSLNCRLQCQPLACRQSIRRVGMQELVWFRSMLGEISWLED